MEFHDIRISDRAAYEKHSASLYRQGEEFSFSTIFIWKNSFHTTVHEDGDAFYIACRTNDGKPYYLMPIGSGSPLSYLERLYREADKSTAPFCLSCLTETDVKLIRENLPASFSEKNPRRFAEYIYKTKDLISLSGKKLHGKRNHLNTFRRSYTYNFSAITAENIDLAAAFVYARCADTAEEVAMRLLFLHYFDLGLVGMILFADDRIAAVTVGERLNRDTALIHLEKADTAFSGAYTAVNQMFLENFFSDTVYVNREEDMDIPGLRKAKLSYCPAYLLQKYTLTEVL